MTRCIVPGSRPAALAGERPRTELLERGVDVLLDDRDARARVKFADAELVGIHWRVTIGRALARGQVELTERVSNTTERVAATSAVDRVVESVEAARA